MRVRNTGLIFSSYISCGGVSFRHLRAAATESPCSGSGAGAAGRSDDQISINDVRSVLRKLHDDQGQART